MRIFVMFKHISFMRLFFARNGLCSLIMMIIIYCFKKDVCNAFITCGVDAKCFEIRIYLFTGILVCCPVEHFYKQIIGCMSNLVFINTHCL